MLVLQNRSSGGSSAHQLPLRAGLCAEQSWGVNLGIKFQGQSESLLSLIRPAGQHVQAGSCCSGIQHGGTSSNKIRAKSLN